MSIVYRLLLKYRDLLLYGLIGGGCATLDFVVYTILCCCNVNHLIANFISTNVGIICSFYLNRKYNFRIKNKTILRFFSFYSVGLVGLGLSTLLLVLLVDQEGFNAIYSKLLTIIFVAIVQFILNKYITFKYGK